MAFKKKIQDGGNKARESASKGARKAAETAGQLDRDSLTQAAIRGSGAADDEGNVSAGRVIRAAINPKEAAIEAAAAVGKEAYRQIKNPEGERTSELPATEQQPAAWYSDPYHRFEFRWWNGSTWTEDVNDGETARKDPDPLS